MGKILVTAGGGKVSSTLIDLLIKANKEFRIGLRNINKIEQYDWQGCDVSYLDFENSSSFLPALEGIEKVFMIQPNSTAFYIPFMKSFVDEVKKAGIQQIVFMTAFGVEFINNTPLRVVEKYIEESGLNYTFVRPGWFMQNFIQFHGESIRGTGGIYLPAGDGKSAFIDVRDIAAVIFETLFDEIHINKSYGITGAEALDHFQVVEKISSAIGKEVKYYPLTDEQAREGFLKFGITPEYTELMLFLYSTVRKGFAATITPDVQNILEREPISFDKFVSDYAPVWK